MSTSSDHVAKNRAYWDAQAAEYAAEADREWSSPEPSWGIWGVPESELGVLPEEVAGLDVVELGCGTAYISAWLARRGARPVGIDNSPEQLATARRMQARFGLEFPLHLGDAEATPFDDASFDLAISEYGASIWCDPQRWIAEAARLLRPGGQLIFLINSTLMMLTMPEADNVAATDRLVRPLRGMHRLTWSEPSGVEFHISPGEQIRLLRRSGFEIEDLIEVYAPEGGTTRHPFVTAAWANRWPSEEIWKARKWL
ncbi:MAG TPA: methyltransferase domain-containing protein [Kofleriaceae bacterium]|jgi:ubiquinone/menaquinone biosynthesis C-methylase UbiE|nr:methyltransferase domain-containing protein [Kofleriaceae bacterium]